MSTQVQFRRGTRAQGLAFTGAVGEASLDTDRGAKSGSRWRIHDGVAAGGNLQASLADLQEMEGVYGAATQGGSPASPDELVLTHSEPIISYIEGLQIAWKQPAENVGSVQVNVDDKGFKDLKQNDATGTPAELSPADLVANGIYTAIYDGNRFIVGGALGGSGGGAWEFLERQVFTAVTSIDFEAGTWTDFDAIKLILTEVFAPTTDNKNLAFRLKVGGSYPTVSYAYIKGHNYDAASAKSGTSGAASNSLITTVGAENTVVTTANMAQQWDILLSNPAGTAKNKFVSWVMGGGGGSTFGGQVQHGVGWHSASQAALTGIRLLLQDGTTSNLTGIGTLLGLKKV